MLNVEKFAIINNNFNQIPFIIKPAKPFVATVHDYLNVS